MSLNLSHQTTQVMSLFHSGGGAYQSKFWAIQLFQISNSSMKTELPSSSRTERVRIETTQRKTDDMRNTTQLARIARNRPTSICEGEGGHVTNRILGHPRVLVCHGPLWGGRAESPHVDLRRRRRGLRLRIRKGRARHEQPNVCRSQQNITCATREVISAGKSGMGAVGNAARSVLEESGPRYRDPVAQARHIRGLEQGVCPAMQHVQARCRVWGPYRLLLLYSLYWS